MIPKYLLEHVSDADVEDTIKKYIKKAVKKNLYKYADLIEEICMAFSKIKDKNKYKECIQNICDRENNELEHFFEDLYEDYYKKKQMIKNKKAINNQNVKVQSFCKDNKCELRLASSSNPKKKALFDTLKDFSVDPDREYKYIKELIILYFYGEDSYYKIKKENNDKWGMGDYLKSINYSKNSDLIEVEKIIELVNKCNDKEQSFEFKEAITCLKTIIGAKLDEKLYKALEVRNIPISDKEFRIKEGREYSKDEYWLRYINSITYNCMTSNGCKRILSKGKDGAYIKNDCIYIKSSFLAKMVWEKWYKNICIKYIDMGKAVYHFAMPNCRNIFQDCNSNDVKFGDVLDEYKYGITSFDYERIIAEDDLDRKVSMYVSYAVNNFRISADYNNTYNSDIMLAEQDNMIDICKNNTKCIDKIFRFFGGKTKWNSFIENNLIVDNKEDFVFDIKEFLYAIRNSAFHYTSEKGIISDVKNKELFNKMYKFEYDSLSELYRRKWYSNNMYMWYNNDDIYKIMDSIYSSSKYNKMGMPSYNKILKRTDMPKICCKDLYIDFNKYFDASFTKKDIKDRFNIFLNSLYYMLKEIYYYKFLNDDSIKDKFMDIIKREYDELKNDKDKKKEEENQATEDFCEHLDKKLRNLSMNEICHAIMSDYNFANNQIESAKDGNKKEKKKFKHYPLLLYKYLNMVFIDFIKTKKYDDKHTYLDFIKNMNIKFGDELKVATEEEFCKMDKNFASNYNQISFEDDYLLAWYVAGHFLSPRYLNLLIGVFKDYIVRIEDIRKRANNARSALRDKTICDINKKRKTYEKYIEILDFVLQFSGQTSNKLEDYFESKDAYAKEIMKYVSIKQDSSTQNDRPSKLLSDFCNKEITNSDSGYIGLYYDGSNPILNKNVVSASMYCNTDIIHNSTNKITFDDIKGYYDSKKSISEDNRNDEGVFKSEEDLNKYMGFVNKKNRVELVNINIYSELLNELYGKMISWAYLRERDSMYLQLGYFYLYLNQNKQTISDEMEKIEDVVVDNNKKMNVKYGLVLYQLIALYTYGVKYVKIKTKKLVSNGKSQGVREGKLEDIYKDKTEILTKIKAIRKVMEKEETKQVGGDSQIIDFSNRVIRNQIDHFSYFREYKYSILDLYSQFYNEFLKYNDSFRKKIPQILLNSLYRVKVDCKTVFNNANNNDRRKGVCIELEKCKTKIQGKTIEGVTFYKYKVYVNTKNKKTNKIVKNVREISVPANIDVYVNDILNILKYKEN